MPELGLLPRDYSIAVPQIQWGLAGDISTTPPAITPDLRAAARAHMMGAIAAGIGSGIGAYQKSKSAQDELALKKEALRIREQQIQAATAKENQPNAAEATRQALENAWTKDTPVSPAIIPAVEPELPTGGVSGGLAVGDGEWRETQGTQFGLVRDGKGGFMDDPQDPIDAAKGIPGFDRNKGAYGHNIKDPELMGVALSPAEMKAAGLNPDDPKALVEVSANGKTMRVPIVDKLGTPGKVDLTGPLLRELGGPDHPRGSIEGLRYRIIPTTPSTNNIVVPTAQNIEGPLNEVQIPMDDGRIINIPSESLTASTNGAGMPANVSITPAVAPLADFGTAVAGLDQNAYNSALARSVYDENGNLVAPYKPDAPDLTMVPFQADAPVMRAAPLAGVAPAVAARTVTTMPAAPLENPQFDTTLPVRRPIGNMGHDSRTGAMIYSPSPTEATAFLPGLKGKGIAKDISPPKPATPMVREIKKADGSTVLEGFDPATGSTVYTRPGDAPAHGGDQIAEKVDEKLALTGADYANMTPEQKREALAEIATRNPTQDQGKTQIYLGRSEGANQNLEQVLKSFDPTTPQNAARVAASKNPVTNYFSTPEAQKFRQAALEFTSAILRKDSGATITANEEAIANATWIPMAGDSKEILEQKRVARERAIEELRGILPKSIQPKSGGPTTAAATQSASPSAVFLKQVAEVKKEYEAGAYDSDPSRKAAVEARLRKYGLIQ